MELRDYLIRLSLINKGEYSKIIFSYKAKEKTDDIDIYGLKSPTLVIGDEEYPQFFKVLSCPPLVLYYYGDLSLFKFPLRIGVIGSRKPTAVGYTMIDNYLGPVLEQFAMRGEKPVIVNGMAKGIDIAAARKAMEYQLPVIMYLGSGIDCIYPPEATDVYAYCRGGHGLILSEYPLDTLPLAAHFPFRNRLIAASSQGLLLPEAKMPSGSYSTINYALDLGKDIATFPVTIAKELSLNNLLISEGASIILNTINLFDFFLDLKNNDR